MNLPPYCRFPELSNGRIFMRQIVSNDIKYILEISFYDGKVASDVEAAAEIQQKINANYQNGEGIHWGIIDIATQKIVGTCGYYRGFDNQAGELGCVLLPQFQKLGYMTQAMQLAIQFGIHEMGLKRIWAATTKDNYGALSLLYRLQFIEVSSKGDSIIFEFNMVSRNK